MITVLNPERSDLVAAIAINKSRLAVTDKHTECPLVFMNHGQEFQIELFNGTHNEVLAKVAINGLQQGEGIVLMPAQRVFLDRFIDVNKKLMFSTYEIDAKNEWMVSNNGLIQITFHSKAYFNASNSTWMYVNSSPWTTNTPDVYRVYTGAVDITNGTPTFSEPVNSHRVTCNYTSTIETGRVVEGKQSDQEFLTTYGSFNAWPMHTVQMRIVPVSAKQFTSKDLRKYCTSCGKRLKESWGFCPACGTKS